ncbi:MAG: hypothetical protein HRF50_09965 [Phycisphaerae bacterium]
MFSKSIKCLAACRIATAMLTGCNEDLIPPAPVASFDSFVYPAYDYGASYWDADTSGGCSAKDSGGYWGGSQDESSLLAENMMNSAYLSATATSFSGREYSW